MCCNNYIYRKKLKIIINSKAFINIISKTVLYELKITNQLKKFFYGFIAIDELKIFKQKTMDKEIKLLLMQIQQYNKHIIFNIIDMVNHQIVLKIPWLEEYNPKINWKMHNFKFDKCRYTVTFKFQH